jgi:PqqD family protein of HPr-rel-A system
LRYALTCPGYRLRRWESAGLVFNPLSGSTHLLSDAAIEVLLGLHEVASPQSAADLSQRFFGAPEGAPELESVLNEFVLLGLAEAVGA